MDAFVEVSGLRVIVESAAAPGGAPDAALVEDIGFTIPRGEVLALIGESGSGKTTIALSLLGYARPGCRIAAGRLRVGDIDLRTLDAAGLEAVRGTRIAYVAQSAAAAFNPAHTLLDQVIESGLIRRVAPRAELEARAIGLFESMSLPEPRTIGRRYPHQVSGGQLQRVMAAMAMVADPDLVVFDEPTTALDVTTQIEVLHSIRQAMRERGTTAVYVSHDLAVVAQVADRIVVLERGRIRESGAMEQVLRAPADAYTRKLVAAQRPDRAERAPVASLPAQGGPPVVESGAARPAATGARVSPAPLLRLRGISAGYGPTDSNGRPRTTVLHDLDLELGRGRTVGVVGESGSGKSTLARVIAGLVPAARGTLELDGAPLPPTLAARSRDHFRRIQLVFQDADTSLNPAHTIERLLLRPLQMYRAQRGAAAQAEAARLLDLVQLPASMLSRLPRELSGGQKQRISLARALAAQPDLLLCDEVTASLDTIVGAAIVELLAALRRELGLSILFISHDIGTLRAVCEEVLVLYGGRRVQRGDCDALSHPPFHPYTGLLVASVPQMRRGWLDEAAPRALRLVPGAGSAAPHSPRPASAADATPAVNAELCPFLARCPQRIDGLCDRRTPPVRVGPRGGEIACHLEVATLLASQAGGLDARQPMP